MYTVSLCFGLAVDGDWLGPNQAKYRPSRSLMPSLVDQRRGLKVKFHFGVRVHVEPC